MKRFIYFLFALVMFNVQCWPTAEPAYARDSLSKLSSPLAQSQPSMFNVLRAQRNCGLWLNEVPLVADTAANSIYATIEPRVDCSLKGTLRWDESQFTGVTFKQIIQNNGNLRYRHIHCNSRWHGYFRLCFWHRSVDNN